MAPLSKSACAFAALAALGVASAAISCPTSNPKDTRRGGNAACNLSSLRLTFARGCSCLCTSGCSINGDNTSFIWAAPTFPPPLTNVLSDTICATVVVPCTPAAASLNAFLGVTGDIQMDGAGGNDLVGCQANAQLVMHTGFTAAECANFATLFNALAATSPSVPAPLLCTSSGCNALIDAVASPAAPAARAAAGVAALVALGAALL